MSLRTALLLGLLAMSPAAEALAGLRPEHPRLLLLDARVQELRQLIATDPGAQELHRRLRAEAERLAAEPPLAYEHDGTDHQRLLSISRAAVTRVLAWGLLYRLERGERWLTRLRHELMALCAFSDWHPAHFLDTAEMALAVAVGYDWLYESLPETDRLAIRTALVEKAIQPGLVGGWWVDAHHNWNQVCHGGLMAAALAVAEQEPKLAARIAEQARVKIDLALGEYAPDGTYPEGPSYWAYGTSYSVILAALLESALGTTWAIETRPGFAASFAWRLHADGPSGRGYNFADSADRADLLIIHHWLARRADRPELATLSWQKTERLWAAGHDPLPWLWPLHLLWYQPPQAATASLPLAHVGRGAVHVASLRSAWDDPMALGLFLKAGKVQVNHGHLDIGSVILEADGVRWSCDLGMEEAIYARKDAWGLEQDAKRWRMLRANNFSHSTLTLGGALQRVAGDNPITGPYPWVDGAAVVADCSAAYVGQAASVCRGVALLPGRRQALIQDEIHQAGGDLRWQFCTRAQIVIADDGQSAVLSEAGQRLQLRILAGAGCRFGSASLKPPTPEENANEGFLLLTITHPAPLPADLRLAVLVTPGSAGDREAPPVRPLAEWSASTRQ